MTRFVWLVSWWSNFHLYLLKPRIRLQFFCLSNSTYKLVNLLGFEKISFKMRKIWDFVKIIGLGLNITYEFEVCYILLVCWCISRQKGNVKLSRFIIPFLLNSWFAFITFNSSISQANRIFWKGTIYLNKYHSGSPENLPKLFGLETRI